VQVMLFTVMSSEERPYEYRPPSDTRYKQMLF